MDILFFFCRYKFGRATSFFLYTENKSRTMKNFCIWQFHKWFQCLCFLQFGFYWDMQLYGHKQHNYRNDANFRKLTGKVLCIAFLRFLISWDFFRTSVTLYHIRDCDNELFYCLSVKIFERKFRSQICLTSTNLSSKSSKWCHLVPFGALLL